MDKNSCNGCTLCCKVVGVPEISKPMNIWCNHCNKGSGCRIYSSRPTSCQEFECLFLQAPLPEELRPSRCKVVFSTSKDGTNIQAHVDPGYPSAHREPAVASFIEKMGRAGITVIIIVGNQRTAIVSRDKIGALKERIGEFTTLEGKPAIAWEE